MNPEPGFLAQIPALLSTLAIVIGLFGLTIFVHELGHYLVARLCGLVVETFSIGFGPALWKRKIGGITYKIGCIPCGGYVALPQLDPTHGLEAMDAKKDAEKADASDAADAEPPRPPLPRIAPWRRILVSIAGATGNLLLAYAISWAIYLHGKPSSPDERSAEIGYVGTNSVAWAAGLRPGDRLLTVAGRPVENWMNIHERTTFANAERVPVEAARRDGTRVTAELDTVKVPAIGARILSGVSGVNIIKVLDTERDSSAERAGLRRGDILTALDGETLFSRDHMIDLVNAAAGREVAVVLRRGTEEIRTTVRPVMDPKEKRARIGIKFDIIGNVDFDQVVHPRPMDQMKAHAYPVFKFLKALVTPKESGAAAGAAGGPVSIFSMYWYVVSSSFVLALYFTALLNVNLAILNLLPLPVLDGGHVVFSLAEAVRRKPLNPKLIEIAHTVFAYLLITVFVLLTGRDIYRQFILRRRAPPAVEQPAPEAPAVTNAPAPAAK